jgi:hypothetical protein
MEADEGEHTDGSHLGGPPTSTAAAAASPATPSATVELAMRLPYCGVPSMATPSAMSPSGTMTSPV